MTIRRRKPSIKENKNPEGMTLVKTGMLTNSANRLFNFNSKP